METLPAERRDNSMVDSKNIKIHAQLDQKVLTARAFPRDEQLAYEKAKRMATMDFEVAQSCIYEVPRKEKVKNKFGKDEWVQKNIKGPSVRLAEIIASCWGNLEVGTRLIVNDGEKIVVQGWCVDLQENNTMYGEGVKSIIKSSGERYTDHLQATVIAAASSVAFRNAVFKIIPLAVVNLIYKACLEKVQNDTELLKKRDGIFSRLSDLGVSQLDVLTYFGKKSIQDITPQELVEIIGIGTSISDGVLKAEEAFRINIHTGEVSANSTDQLMEAAQGVASHYDDSSSS